MLGLLVWLKIYIIITCNFIANELKRLENIQNMVKIRNDKYLKCIYICLTCTCNVLLS